MINADRQIVLSSHLFNSMKTCDDYKFLTGNAPMTILDLTTDNHMHSIYSDGSATIEEIASKAIEKGLQKIIFTDHMPLPFITARKHWGNTSKKSPPSATALKGDTVTRPKLTYR